MEVKAQLNGLRMAPRKVRLVVGLVKKKDVDAALDQLAHLGHRAARPVSRVISSAIANAEHNHRMVRSNLYIKNAWVDEGLKLRRWMPKAFGRAGAIQKKTSHVNIVLDERVAGVRAAEEPTKEAEKPQAESAEQEADVSRDKKKSSVVKPVTEQSAPAKGLRGFSKKLFRRKSI